MREWRSRWSVLAMVLAGLFLASPGIAEAAARVLVPGGWGENAAAATEAQRRASRWQDALGLRLAQVLSAPQDDRFAETIAVFERLEPVDEQAFADEAAAVDALVATVANVVGDAPPDQTELRTTASGERLVWARWAVDELIYECALAPSGSTSTIVVTAVLANEIEIHRSTLARVFDELEGVSAPMPRFSLLHWRVGSILVWIALALGLHATMLQLGDRDNDHNEAGKRASGICLVLVLVGTAFASVSLRGRELALIHEGSSVAGLTVWIAVAGIVVVGAHFLIASRYDRGVVRSAPSSGAFASGTFSTAEVMRASASRSGMYRPKLDELESSTSLLPTASASQVRARIVIDDSEHE